VSWPARPAACPDLSGEHRVGLEFSAPVPMKSGLLSLFQEVTIYLLDQEGEINHGLCHRRAQLLYFFSHQLPPIITQPVF